ncbi:hypothetical protein RUND412_003224 [Rhizina undulata]
MAALSLVSEDLECVVKRMEAKYDSGHQSGKHYVKDSRLDIIRLALRYWMEGLHAFTGGQSASHTAFDLYSKGLAKLQTTRRLKKFQDMFIRGIPPETTFEPDEPFFRQELKGLVPDGEEIESKQPTINTESVVGQGSVSSRMDGKFETSDFGDFEEEDSDFMAECGNLSGDSDVFESWYFKENEAENSSVSSLIDLSDE